MRAYRTHFRQVHKSYNSRHSLLIYERLGKMLASSWPLVSIAIKVRIATVNHTCIYVRVC